MTILDHEICRGRCSVEVCHAITAASYGRFFVHSENPWADVPAWVSDDSDDHLALRYAGRVFFKHDDDHDECVADEILYRL